ncbi:MAG: hypothetical protein FWH21_00125 [Kiritimatiellaeota bacterium]|nr:hypothetical protein [Kiritimatiellota bacterium]
MAFETIHQEVCNILARDEFLAVAGVEIHCEDKGDIDDTVKGALARLGIVAVVAVPSARAESSDSRNVTARADIAVQVSERPLMNRGRANMRTAGEAARHIAVALNLARLPDGETVVFKDISSAVLEKGALIYNISFEALTTLFAPPPKKVENG